MKITIEKLIDNIYIILTITFKDIIDALNNKLILSMIVGLSVMLLVPKGLSLIIVPPYTDVVVYDPGNSTIIAILHDSPLHRVRQADTIDELEQIIGALGFGLGAEVGIAVPSNFDQRMGSGEQIELDGFVNWSNRTEITRIKLEFEDQIEELYGQPVHINFAGNLVYPQYGSALILGILTITIVSMILMIGITLVPYLLIEEKQTKTIEAMLVSPVSITQIVTGKALAGCFYVLVTAAIVFIFYWSGVVNWGLAILFVIGAALFSVAVGLVLGSFFERQQEIGGWIMVLLIVFIVAMFVDMLDLQLPAFIQTIIPLVPSVALGEVFIAAFSVGTPAVQIIWNLVSIILISLVMYTIVIWKIRGYDK
jgi:ABC-2 type transport system permease protein